jgi:hypothetical protein
MLSLRGHIAYAGGIAPARRPAPSVAARDRGGCAVEDDAFCPHCGGPLDREPPLLRHPCFDDEGERIAGTRVQPGAWRTLTALRAAFGHFVGRDYLLAHIRPRKGEDAAPKLVDVYLCHLRRALAPTPFTLEARRGAGRWRLTWRHPAEGGAP